MKKLVKIFSVALLVVVFAVAFAGCDKSGSIKKAFESEGYTVTTVDADDSGISTLLGSVLDDEQKELLKEYELLLCSKTLPVAVVVKFGSAKEIKDFLKVEDSDGNEDTSVYDEAKDAGYINGNCYLITLSKDALKIFKNA